MVMRVNIMMFRMLLVSMLLLNTACAKQTQDAISKPAIFQVTTDIVNKNVQPFSATINGFGNTLIKVGSGFEPVVFRNKFFAIKNSPNRIIASPKDLTRYDTLREGFLDNAEVHVYRIKNGRIKLARKDRVKSGGAHSSGWIKVNKGNKIVPASTSQYYFRWSSWNRPNASYYFMVRAVDKYGNFSSNSSTVEIISPKKLKTSSNIKNTLVKFKPPSSLFTRKKRIPAPLSLRGNVSSENVLTLVWEPINDPDIAGYIVYRSDYPPGQHSGHYLQLTNTPKSKEKHIKAGDLIIVHKKIYSPSRIHNITNRVWNASKEYGNILPGLINIPPDEIPDKKWSLIMHDDNTPVKEPGETYIELKLAKGATQSIGLYNHSGTEQSWYDVLEKKKYKVEVWLRKEGKGSIKFKLAGFYEKSPHKIKPIVFDVDNKWKKYTAYFTPPVIQSGSTPYKMELELTGDAVFNIDNFRIYRADTPYLDFLPREFDAISSSGVSALRTHGFIKTGISTYDMNQLTNAGGVTSGTQKSNTLPQTLKMMRKASTNPWLQIEYHMNPQEWLAFIEYMAAPYNYKIDTPETKPWAFKRYNQGQTKPWTEEFDKIYFELSNETWNGLFRPWVFTPMTDVATKKRYTSGEVYGLFQENVISIMRSSPYWKQADLDKKFSFVLGGWSAQPKFGKDAVSASPSTDVLAVAAYNGGWDEDEGPPKLNAASLFNTMAQVNQTAIPKADLYSKLIHKNKKQLSLGTYEAGPGYALNGLNNAKVSKTQAREQEQVMKSLAAGTATLDSFLARAYRGYGIQNFFTFDSGELWKSYAKWYKGGQAYPSWKLISLFNRQATGDMLRTETLSVPTADIKAFSRRQGVTDAPLVAIYATKNSSRVCLFVISRKIPNHPVNGVDGYTPVEVKLPFTSAKTITLYRMSGKPDANNLLSDNVVIDKLNISPANIGDRLIINSDTGSEVRGLPPASTFLYVFDGVNADNS